jgi:hypothetical protein
LDAAGGVEAGRLDWGAFLAADQGDFLAGFSLPDSLGFDEWQFLHAAKSAKNAKENGRWNLCLILCGFSSIMEGADDEPQREG